MIMSSNSFKLCRPEPETPNIKACRRQRSVSLTTSQRGLQCRRAWDTTTCADLRLNTYRCVCMYICICMDMYMNLRYSGEICREVPYTYIHIHILVDRKIHIYM